jgi:exonuclease III
MGDPIINNNYNNINSAYNLKFCAQNCQSLNVSIKSDKTMKKILALVKHGEDVIFLSDIRLNSNGNQHAAHDVEKKFFAKNYRFFHNSKTSSRGVGLAIKRDILKNVIATETDANNNFIIVKVELNSGTWLLGSVYGPNENDLGFFTDLGAAIERQNCDNTVIAGDWNCTWDPRPADQNLDVLNMAAIPSRQRSNCINQLASGLGLSDPYRILNPIKREFTYVPNARLNLNRSRIDYFLIKKDMSDNLIDCTISHSLTSTSFDHKKITLYMGKNKKKGL